MLYLDEDPEERRKTIAHILEQRGFERFELEHGRAPDSLERAKIRREAISGAKSIKRYLLLYAAELILIMLLLSKHL